MRMRDVARIIFRINCPVRILRDRNEWYILMWIQTN